MKMNKHLVAGMAICLAATVGVGLSSCKKDEPTPVIVENPLDAEVYYIAGKVMAGNNALEGVKVTASNSEATTAADGTFQLEMTSKNDYVVTFEKSGYVTVTAEASFPSDAKKQSVVSLVQELEERNLLVKQADEKDKRVINLTLTEEGKEFVELRVTHFHGEWASRLPDLDDAVVDEFVHAITRMQETMPGIKGVKNNGKRK